MARFARWTAEAAVPTRACSIREHAKIISHHPTMLPDIEKLLELQVADREIRKLHDEVATLPKRVAVIEEKLAGTKAGEIKVG